jgi:hypothetical protein
VSPFGNQSSQQTLKRRIVFRDKDFHGTRCALMTPYRMKSDFSVAPAVEAAADFAI